MTNKDAVRIKLYSCLLYVYSVNFMPFKMSSFLNIEAQMCFKMFID